MPDLRKRKFKLLRKRPPKPLAPTGVQISYASELKAMLSFAKSLVRERIKSRLGILLSQSNVDAAHLDADPYNRVNRLMDAVSEAFFKRYPNEKLVKLASKIARLTSEHQKTQLFRQIRSTIGVDLQTIADKGMGERIKRFTAENVALIKTVPQQYFDAVEKTVLTGIREGARAAEIAADLTVRGEVAESRATLIARDQVLKFNGELNKARQMELGIDSYIWRTVKDNRVRDEHAALDGQTFSWDDPPEPGHPGEDFQCRCFSEPIMPGTEEEG